MFKPMLVFTGLMLLAVSLPAVEPQVLVLKSDLQGPVMLEGDASLADRRATPASTFKVLITWAALEEGIVKPSTKYRIDDKHVPGTPRDVTLTQAMFYSSNTYFVGLAKQMGKAKLETYLKKAAWGNGKIPADWIGLDFEGVARAGSMTISPEENHAFMRKIASGALAASPETRKQLEEAMFWPSPSDSVKLYGKTGTMSGGVWFNGYGKTPGGVKVVTVFIPGRTADRIRTIRLFYEAFGLNWDERLAKQLE